MILLLLAVLVAVFVIIDLPLLRRGGMRRDLLFWGIFWTMGISVTVCSLYRINVPSPLLLIMIIYKPINDLFASWFY